MKAYHVLLVVALLFLSAYANKTEAAGVCINNSIEEASGIVYHKARNTLFVVDDEGTIFELSLDGKLLRQKYIGDFDFEGVAIGQSDNELILAIEGEDSILFIDVNSLNIKRKLSIDRKWDGKTILVQDKKRGIEGIHNFGGRILLVNQSYNLNPEENPGDPSMIFEVKEYPKANEFYIYSIIYFSFPDLAGMSEKDGLLYIISDDEDLLLVYDLKSNEVVKQINSPVPGDQEGITFDGDGNLYIAVDGGCIFKTRLQEDDK